MDYASSELRLIRHRVSSGSLKDNQFLSLHTAAKNDGFLFPTVRDTVILSLYGTQTFISSIVFPCSFLTLITAVKHDSVLIPGKQHVSAQLYFERSKVVDDTAAYFAPVIATAIISGKHIGNTLPSTPKPLNLRKAEIVPGTAPIDQTYSAILRSVISPAFLFRDAGICKEMKLFTHSVSATALFQGQAEYDLNRGVLAHISIPGEERTGKELKFCSSHSIPSAVTQYPPEIIRAIKEGQMPSGGESKVDQRLTIESGTSGKVDEQIILTISRARVFLEQELLRSIRDECQVETHVRLELMKGAIEKTFVEAGSRSGIELSPEKCQIDQSSVSFQPQLRLVTALVSGKFEGAVRSEKLRQFGLSSSTAIESLEQTNQSFILRNAVITGKIIGKDLPAVPVEFPLIRTSVQDSDTVTKMDSPLTLSSGILSGAFFGGGNQHGLNELVLDTMIWIGSFRFDEMVFIWGANSSISFDLRILLNPCSSFDGSITVERIGYAASDETVDLARAMSFDSMVELIPCRSLDEKISLKMAGSGIADEQVNLLRNYQESARVDEILLVIARALSDQVISITATPVIADFDETLLTERSGVEKTDEAIVLAMTYYPPIGGAVDSYLRNLEFDESILIMKPEFDESITITNIHNVALLGDVVRDSDNRAKGIIVFAGQDFVLEQ